MNPEEQEHTFWYEQDIFGNIYRIDWYVNSSGLEASYYGKASDIEDFKDTLKWIKQLPEVKK